MSDLANEVINCEVSPINNPFNKDCVTCIMMVARKNSFGTSIYANISFNNGDTSGEQKITAESLPALFDKVQSFIKTL